MERAQSVSTIHAAFAEGECKIGPTNYEDRKHDDRPRPPFVAPANCISAHAGDG